MAFLPEWLDKRPPCAYHPNQSHGFADEGGVACNEDVSQPDRAYRPYPASGADRLLPRKRPERHDCRQAGGLQSRRERQGPHRLRHAGRGGGKRRAQAGRHHHRAHQRQYGYRPGVDRCRARVPHADRDARQHEPRAAGADSSLWRGAGADRRGAGHEGRHRQGAGAA